MTATGRGRTRHVLLSCLASVIVIAAFIFTMAPGITSAASRETAAQANPIRIALTPAVGALGGPPLAPGEAVYRPVAVSNEGQDAFDYSLRVLVAGELADVVTLEVRVTDGPCTEAVFNSSFDVAAGPASLAGLGLGPARPLAAGATEYLCGKLLLPADAMNLVGTFANATLQAIASL